MTAVSGKWHSNGGEIHTVITVIKGDVRKRRPWRGAKIRSSPQPFRSEDWGLTLSVARGPSPNPHRTHDAHSRWGGSPGEKGKRWDAEAGIAMENAQSVLRRGCELQRI